MGKLTLTLSDPARRWIETRVNDGEFEDETAYVAALVEDDRRRHDDLVDALIEGEKSGISDRSVEDIIRSGLAKRRNAPR